MKLLLTALLATSALGSSFTSSDYKSKFVSWAKKHEKVYDVVEFFERFANFKKAMDFVVEHNSGNHQYSVALNQFADMTNEEFTTTMNSLQELPEQTNVNLALANVTNATLPDAVDWTTKGAVSPVKQQGQCGSCWAFSTIGSLEGANFIKNGKLVEFSEQQLVDCSAAEGNHGCSGGLMDQGFKYIEQNGICSEEAYPYTGTVGTCQDTTCQKAAGATTFTDVPKSNLDALAAAAAQQPVSIAVDAGGFGWQLYHSGIYHKSLFHHCGTQLDHGVLLVGYGDEAGSDFWKVKNSWGPQWGESGYIRLAKTSGMGDGMCGLALCASYVTAA